MCHAAKKTGRLQLREYVRTLMQTLHAYVYSPQMSTQNERKFTVKVPLMQEKQHTKFEEISWGWRDFFPALALFCFMLFVLRF